MLKTAANTGLRGRTVRFASAAAAFVYMAAGLFVAVFATALFSISASALLVLDNLENTTGWAGTCSPESRNVHQGRGALRITSNDFGDGRLLCLAQKQMSPVDISKYADGYIRFYLYVENEDNLGDESQFELTSSGTCDQEELTCMINTLDLKSGWNELIYSIEELSGSVQVDKVNFIRLYMFQTGPQTLILDDICIGSAADFGIGEVPIKERTVQTLEACDSAESFTIGSKTKPSVFPELKVEGSGAVGAQTDGDFTLTKTFDKPFDISDYVKSGYIYLWLYVENADALQGSASLALRSSGKDMAAWSIGGLKDGWNELLLKFSDTNMGSGAIDYKKIKELTLTVGNSGANLFAVDRILYGYSRDFGIKSDDDPPITQAEQTANTPKVTSANAGVYKTVLVLSVCVVICAAIPLLVGIRKPAEPAGKNGSVGLIAGCEE
jgi:hypothetical protein